MDAAGWNQHYDTFDRVGTAETNRLLVAETGSPAPVKARDVGAGEGHNAVRPARAATGVAPGGTLLVAGHDTATLTDDHGGPQGPDVLFPPGEGAAELAGSERVLETQERLLRTGDIADGEWVASDALVRAHGPGQP